MIKYAFVVDNCQIYKRSDASTNVIFTKPKQQIQDDVTFILTIYYFYLIIDF